MIKISKDISAIPDSLKLPNREFFPKTIPRPPKTTHLRRMEVINGGKYIDTDLYNGRYKQEDVRIAIKEIYKNKCAFCEQYVEQGHIEHYRPKNTYFWLAYSWDNLLYACSGCNQYKSINFDIKGTLVTFVNTEENIRNIHKSSSIYDKLEKPKLINPEVTDPSGKIKFKKNGVIESDDDCFAYTIDKCKLDRKGLNDQRRKLIDKFKDHIRAVLHKYDNPAQQSSGIETIVMSFITDTNDPELPFIAFRKYAIFSGWLNDIVKELN